ncbi:hypothetical protein [Halobacillus mangrovi]|uniref:hypothetical protein n=1 Tax=Halobacillus mangrovi TaxID=402384 RepID=UPI003D953856
MSFICLAISGCTNDSEEFEITGEITRIEDEMISIGTREIIVNNVTKYKVGQKVKATLIDHTAEEDWDPDDYEVKEIEIID